MAVLIVDNASGENDGNTQEGRFSLREALTLANDDPGADSIVFASSLAGRVISLALGELQIATDVTIRGDINGDGAADILISGNGLCRIFSATGNDTDVAIESLTLTAGAAISGNGGAIIADGIASLTIRDATIRGNMAAGGGGGIYARGTSVIIGNSLIAGNAAHSNGGGLYLSEATATLVNATLHGNTAQFYGGGASVAFDSSLMLYSSTIAGNRAAVLGGGIDEFLSTVHVRNTAIAGNPIGAANVLSDLNGSIDTAEYSFLGTESQLGTATGCINGGGDPLLGQLLDNGGTVLSLACLDGSPLIDAGGLANMPPDRAYADRDGDTLETLPRDGRHGARVFGAVMDIGAVERAASEIIRGTPLADVIRGGSGADMLFGRGGNDLFVGGAGADTVNGGIGIDTLSFAGSLAGVHANLAAGLASGGDGSGDRLVGIENLGGSIHADILIGNALANRLNGASGNDRLAGGPGGDQLAGGAGADTFVYRLISESLPGAGCDVILDFNRSQGDRIDLSAIDAVPGGGNDAFRFTADGGKGSFGNLAGEARVTARAGKTLIQADANGDGLPDLEIEVVLTGPVSGLDIIL